jgi:Zn-dependent protease with chaperone function
VKARWPAREVQIVDQHGDSWRLTSRRAPDTRLVVPKSADIDAALRQFGALAPGRETMRHAGFIAALVAAAAAIASLAFLVVPMMAEPLARVTPRAVEAQLGENLSEQILLIMKPCESAAARRAKAAIQPMLKELSDAAAPGFALDVVFVQAEAPNAFAMPGGRIMVTSARLEALKRPEELEAVVAHEIGHVKARDSMVALYRNVGLGVLLEIVTGGSGIAQQIVALGGQAAQLSYTRAQEERADLFAIAALRAAGRDPAMLASAFRALEGSGAGDSESADSPGEANGFRFRIPGWLQSHPELAARVAVAEAAASPASRATPLSEGDWEMVQHACRL